MFSPDHVTPLLELLIAVIDQDQPILGQEESTQDDRGSLSQDEPLVQSPPSLAGVDERGLRGKATGVSEFPISDSKASPVVHRVSCTGVGARADGVGRGTVPSVAAGAEARRELLQRACLRLFVTGMDLFFPSCAQRCSLLARYLSKYLRCVRSAARE